MGANESSASDKSGSNGSGSTMDEEPEHQSEQGDTVPELMDTEQHRVFRKYESAINSSGKKRPGMIKQESIMSSVYVRMKDKDLNSVADTLGPQFINVNSSSGSQRELLIDDASVDEAVNTMTPDKARKTFCFDVSFTLSFTMATTFSLLLVAGLIAMVVVPTVYTQRILDEYQSVYAFSVEQLLYGSSIVVNNNSQSFGTSIVRGLSRRIQSEAIELPVTALGSVWNFYRALPDQTTPLEEQIAGESALRFVYFQMIDFFTTIPNLYFAFLSNNLYGYQIPRSTSEEERQLILESGIGEFFLYAEAQQNFSDFNSLALIFRCPLIDDQGGSDLQACSNEEEGRPYNTTLRPWFVIQSELAGQENKLSRLKWTDLYPYATRAEGYTLTWPINKCGNYSCFEGVLSADVSTRVVSALCNSTLYETLFELGARENASVVSIPTAFYVVVRRNVQDVFRTDQSGLIVGGAINNSTFTGPIETIEDGTFQSVFNSTDPLVRNSSDFLFSQYGPFYQSIYDETMFSGYNVDTLQPCTCFGLDEESFRCMTVSTIGNTGDYTGPNQEALARNISWMSVTVLPCSVFLRNYNETVQQVRQAIQEEALAANDAHRRQIIVTVVLAFGLLIIVILITFLMAYCIARPLTKVKDSMVSLRNFDFERTYLHRFSRIKEIAEIQATFVALRRALITFEKFVPTTVVRNIVNGGKNTGRLHVKNKEVTILFSDIANFTSIAEKLEINDLLYLLTSYLTIMTRIIENYEGVVAEILGDGLLVFWNTPDEVEEHAAKALATALACQQSIRTSFNDSFKDMLAQHNLPPITIRIGIHTGTVLTGNIGSETKMKFGCMGDPVNLASRLEGLCKLYGVEIICSQDTMQRLPTPQTFFLRELDLVTVKGKSHPTRIFQVLCQDEPIHNTVDSENGSSKVLNRVRKTSSATSRTKRATSSIPDVPGIRRYIRQGSLQPNDKKGTSLGTTKMVIHVQDDVVDDATRMQVFTYESALRSYQDGDFTVARDAILTVPNRDAASSYLLERIEAQLAKEHKEESKGEMWTGVNTLYGKDF